MRHRQFQGGPNVTLASVYLVTGEGVRHTNIDILVDLGTELRKRAQPFIVAGDFQVEPAALHDTSFPPKIRANIVAPEGAMGTCVTKEGYSTIDYFLVSEGLAPSVERVYADVRRYANPHRPVYMRLRKDFPERRIRVWTHRARLAIEVPFGPRRMDRCWEGPLAAANKALDIAHRAGRAKETQAVVTAAYSLIAAAAASEIACVGDQCIEQKFLKRFGMVPKLQFKSALAAEAENSKRHRRTHEAGEIGMLLQAAQAALRYGRAYAGQGKVRQDILQAQTRAVAKVITPRQDPHGATWKERGCNMAEDCL